MQSKWSQLDTPVRVSMIFGFAMGLVQLFFAAPFYYGWLATPLYYEWPIFLNPMILAENPDSLFWLVIFTLVTLTPFFQLAGSITLFVKTLTAESRGILGFLLLLGGVGPTVLLFFLLALSSS